MWIIEIIVFIIVVLWLLFGGFTFYWVIAGYPALEAAVKKTVSAGINRVVISWGAKFMYWHGIVFIMWFVLMALLLFAVGGGMVVARYVTG